MGRISEQTRRKVISRAGNRCEYCLLSQDGQEATFHIDHIVPISAGGLGSLDNLALACVSCSLRKGARRFAVDPDELGETGLYNPRAHTWVDHFRWHGARIDGLTPLGRATVAALQFNRPLAVAIRHEEILRGRHPAAPRN